MGQASESPLLVAARRAGVRDRRVLDAIGAVRREDFVTAGSRRDATIDAPLPIGAEQVTTQPSLVASMVEALELRRGERVLEVGTGLGYQAAVLAQLAAEVYTVERFPDLAEVARRNLDHAGVSGVHVEVGDGTLGLPEHAPYDAIIVAAASPNVPPALAVQVRTGGRLVQPIGPGGREDVRLFVAGPDGLEPVRTIVRARFVRLVGAQGFDR